MTSDLKSELHGLHDDLRKCADDMNRTLAAGATEASDRVTAELERLFHEIKTHLDEAETKAEDAIAAHPFAATAAAFLLGVAVGRMMGHGR